jgi:hypothetical protein
MAMAADCCDRTMAALVLQLWGIVGNGGSVAAPIFVWCWILNYVIFVLIFDFAVCCHSAYF